MKLFRHRYRKPAWLAAGLAFLGRLYLPDIEANPTGPVVTQGKAVMAQKGSQLTVQTSGNALINWSTFNIGTGETTRFIEPSASSVVWNRINDPRPSQILGHLEANGLIVLQNPAGFYVGGQASISVAGLVMTTSPAVPLDVSSSGMWDFSAPPPSARIINYGQIYAGTGGSVFLIAHDIENHGNVIAPGGHIGLYAGQEVMMSSRPDGRGLSAQVSLPEGSVDDSGRLIADAGTIALQARVVNQGGLIQANSVREQNGVIEVVGGDILNLGASSVIEARGGVDGVSSGGSIALRSGNVFSDQAGSMVSVAGGAQGGAGGVVEVSAASLPVIHSVMDGQGKAGGAGGRLVIDPTDITIGNSGSGSAGSGTVTAGGSSGILNLNVNSAFQGFSQIDLQATHDITIADGTTWDLAASTGISSPGSQLTLEAGNNINMGTSRGANILGGPGWSVTLEAGRSFSLAPGAVTPGNGLVTLAGNGTLQTQDGAIHVLAGNSITVNSGAIRTVNGGSITVNALSGSVNTGKNPNGYLFSTTGYTVSGNLGGISTSTGGDVNISAGGDVTSFLPATTSSSPTDAGSGAFGPELGVVTVTAGGNVYGHFVAADSARGGPAATSTITAQNGDAGAPGNLLALSLVKGVWQVNAPKGSIYLQEVRNPNGALNGKSGGASPFKHFFDYDPLASVDLEAGQTVDLEGTLLPRYTGDNVPVLYPPSLTINAGSGGIVLGNSVTLFPSLYGQLSVTTTSGGTLEGNGYELAMSDSGASSWSSTANFASDHAAVPVQLNNPNAKPVVFNLSGNVDNITIVTPKETQITVAGGMDNTSFSGQNLRASDVTFIDVAGAIFNQNIYSFVTLPSGLSLPAPRFPGDSPNYLELLQNAVQPGSGPSSPNGGLLLPGLSLFYLPATKQLGYYGKMDPNTESVLLGTLAEKTFQSDGQPLLDLNGNYITAPAAFPAAVAIQTLYTSSQNSANQSTAPLGFQIGGPGKLNINAKSMDLGVSGGLVSEGPAINHSLGKVANVGADINLTLLGDLDLFSSQISSYFGGAININAGGAVNAGVQDLPFATPFIPHGIWTSGHSDVTVIAGGDINVAGSRIAAFDGGNIVVESRHGSVDAGSGNSSEVKVNEVIVDPVTHQVSTPQQPIAGSGILATTLPDSPGGESVGNITVTAPQGNITASQGGIVQQPLNGNGSLLPTLTLTAGTRDSSGNIVSPGNIDAGNSGVIGINTILNAAGNISGLVVAQGNSTVNAAANVTGTFLAGGTANFSAAGTISGIAIGGSGINVGSGKFEGVALSQSVTGGGAQTALATSTTASSTSQSAAAQQENSQKADISDANASSADEEKKRRLQRPLLTKYTGRVTVILPPGKK